MWMIDKISTISYKIECDMFEMSEIYALMRIILT